MVENKDEIWIRGEYLCQCPDDYESLTEEFVKGKLWEWRRNHPDLRIISFDYDFDLKIRLLARFASLSGRIELLTKKKLMKKLIVRALKALAKYLNLTK